MAKDPLDPGTKDAFPKKRGRPAISELGPMPSAERKRKQRAGATTVEFHLPYHMVDLLDKQRGELTRDEWLVSLLKPKA